MQESWKRAAQLQRARDAERSRGQAKAPRGGGRGRGTGRRSLRWLWIVLLLLLAAAACALWYFRANWIPRYRDELPEQVAAVLKEPEVRIDWDVLERGLGAGLTLFEPYTTFLETTRDWQGDWKLIDGGSGSLRLESDGLLVYCMGGQIENYEIDLERLYAADGTEKWRQALREAGLSPDLTWTALTGEEAMPPGQREHQWTSPDALKARGGWLRREYVLHFSDGWLRRVEGRYVIGPAESATAPGETMPVQGR